VKIYIGYDTEQDLAYEVCKNSILRRSKDIEIIPIKKTELSEFTRGHDPLASTEFTYTRFLVPYLNDYNGWALFIDCDIIAQVDIENILDYKDDKYKVIVTKHDYELHGDLKMGGKVQSNYPRKNWSSVMLFNCSRCEDLTPHVVNTETPQYLHQFGWCDDGEIGELPKEWNWLSGHYHNGDPKLIHYTDGGPWLEQHKNCCNSKEWNEEWQRTFTS